uniref:Uncharacterized protein n=1 Tax=uncultured Alteromonadales bacterium HF4000_16C08 TaxID=710734 RepID=E0XZ17_9GAMM|nr:hypothetical protein [uncultured Alteromonadales bacterium HF4000_16C08]
MDVQYYSVRTWVFKQSGSVSRCLLANSMKNRNKGRVTKTLGFLFVQPTLWCH